MIKIAPKILLVAVSFTITILLACGNSPETRIDNSGLVNVATITHNTESLIGKSVLVRNDVLERIGKRGLILDKDRVFIGDNILVINTAKIPPLFSDDQTPEVLVSGKVEQFNLTTIKQKYNLNLDPNLYSKYENQPVIIANSIILSPDPGDLTNNPAIYYGKPLAVQGELEDEDLEIDGVFELDEEQVFGGEDLLVVQLKPRIKLDLDDEQTAIVYGTLRPFIAVELARDYDLGWDSSIQEQIEAEYAQKPVFVAEKIQLLAR